LADIEAAYKQLGSSFGHHEVPPEDAQARIIKMALIFGVLLIAAGIFSVIASNWQEFPKTVKILIIYFFLFAAYFGAWRFAEAYQRPKIGQPLYYLGSLIYGAGIMLIGQIFNASANWPDAFIIWMLGVALAAYFLEIYGLFFLGLAVGLVAVVGYPFAFFDTLGMIKGHNPLVLSSTILLAIATLLTFAVGFVIRKKIASDLDKLPNY
jgi:uncharacterized membrane protein